MWICPACGATNFGFDKCGCCGYGGKQVVSSTGTGDLLPTSTIQIV